MSESFPILSAHPGAAATAMLMITDNADLTS
jgi:hypothetical protein